MRSRTGSFSRAARMKISQRASKYAWRSLRDWGVMGSGMGGASGDKPKTAVLYPGAVLRVCARAHAQGRGSEERKGLVGPEIKNLGKRRIRAVGGGAGV